MTFGYILRGAALLSAIYMMQGCSSEAAETPPSLQRVHYQTVTAQTVTLTKQLPGRVASFRVSEVRPQVGGIVVRRLFEEGMDVKAGQVLYELDPSLYVAAYNNAKANLKRVSANEEAARLLAQRRSMLVKEKAVSIQDKDDAVAAHKQILADIEAAKQALETAEIQLGYTKVTAPVSGRIGRSLITEGALVTQNQTQPLAMIHQLSPVYIDVTQPSIQLLHLQKALADGRLHNTAQTTKVRLHLEDGTPFMRLGTAEWVEGEFLFSDVSVQENTGSVTVRAKFDNPDSLLLPGMFVRAELVEGVRHKAILIPQKSVTRDTRNKAQVFVLETAQENASTKSNTLFQVSPRLIDIERDYQGQWLIGAGLKKGDLLLVEGMHKVRAGQKVLGEYVQESPTLPGADYAATQSFQKTAQ